MAVGKYDDDMRDNPKLVKAGDRAAWLWWCGIQYCRNALTDGFIASGQVPHLFVGAVSPRKSATRLVDAGLWIEVQGGYQVHDYLDWNPSKAQVDAFRALERDRKRGKGGESPPFSGLESGSESRSDSVTRAGGISSPLVSSQGSGSAQSNHAASREPVWGPRPTQHGGLSENRHLRCDASAIEACGYGGCVPPQLIAEWRDQCAKRGEPASLIIRSVVEAAIDEKPIIGDRFKFWRGIWDRRQGPPDRRRNGRDAQTADAFDRVYGVLDAKREASENGQRTTTRRLESHGDSTPRHSR